MGSLHAGHLSLVEAARRARCDAVVVSIYVNPTQFAAGEDFDVYPRDAEGDLAACAAANVDAVWMPRDLYDYGQGGDDCGAVTPGSDDPVAHETTVSVARLSRGLRAAGRITSTACRRWWPSCSTWSSLMWRYLAKRTTSSCASCGAWCVTSTWRLKCLAASTCATPMGWRSRA